MQLEPETTPRVPSLTQAKRRSPPLATPRTASTDKSVYFDANSTIDSNYSIYSSGVPPQQNRPSQNHIQKTVLPGDYSFSDTSLDRQADEDFNTDQQDTTMTEHAKDSEQGGKMSAVKDKAINLLPGHKSKDSDAQSNGNVGDEERGRSRAARERQGSVDTVTAKDKTMPLANGVNGTDPAGSGSAVSNTNYSPNPNSSGVQNDAGNKRQSIDTATKSNDYGATNTQEKPPIPTTTNNGISSPAPTYTTVMNGASPNDANPNTSPHQKRASLPPTSSPKPDSLRNGKRSSLPPSRNASPNPASSISSAQAHRADSISSATRRQRTATGAFSAGPGTTGPASVPAGRLENENGYEMVDGGEDRERIQRAEQNLSGQVVGRIEKEEVKNKQKLSKIIKSEAKSQKKSLDQSIKELAQIQKVQRRAAADESAASKALSKSLQDSQKLLSKHLSAKAAYEASQAALRAAEERVAAIKEEARRATEVLAVKAREVEELRVRRGVDEREREVRLGEMGFGEDEKNKGGMMSKLSCF